MKMYFSLLFLALGMIVNAQDSTYKEMTGRYKFPSGSVIEEALVTWDAGILTMSSTAGTSTLEKIKGDTFNIVSFNGICVFQRDATKKINGVHVDASGYVLDGTKDAATLNEYSDLLMEEKLMQTKNFIRERTTSSPALSKPFPALVYN